MGWPYHGTPVNEVGERKNRVIVNTRKRKEAILIKVDEGRDWLEVYKKIMAAKYTIEGATGMRKTRADHILIEFDKKIENNDEDLI
jgi:hypothetical protein